MSRYIIDLDTPVPEMMRDVYERAVKITFDCEEVQWLDEGKKIIIVNPKNQIRPI